MSTSTPSFWKDHSLRILPVSMSALNIFEPCSGVSMFMRRSRCISSILLGVKAPPFFGVMLKDVPVSCSTLSVLDL